MAFVCEWLNYVTDDVTLFFFSIYFPTFYNMSDLLQNWIFVSDTILKTSRKQYLSFFTGNLRILNGN